MKKYYAVVGISSILLVAILLLTCPKESDFQKLLEDEYGIVCSDVNFSCEQKIHDTEENLTFVSSYVRDGVFFTKITQTFETETGETKEYSGIGMLGTFFSVSEKTF